MDKHGIMVMDAAYRVLLDHSDGTLPVSPIKIARSMGIQVVDRRDLGDLFHFFQKEYGEMVESPAFSLSLRNDMRCIVLDRSYRDPEWRRLLVAHELAHFALGHFDDRFVSEDSRAYSLLRGCVTRSLVEISCDIFATWLLAPQAVLARFGVSSPIEIARLCRIPAMLAQLVSFSIKSRGDSDMTQTASMVQGLFSAAILRRKKCSFPRVLPEFATDISEELCGVS